MDLMPQQNSPLQAYYNSLRLQSPQPEVQGPQAGGMQGTQLPPLQAAQKPQGGGFLDQMAQQMMTPPQQGPMPDGTVISSAGPGGGMFGKIDGMISKAGTVGKLISDWF